MKLKELLSKIDISDPLLFFHNYLQNCLQNAAAGKLNHPTMQEAYALSDHDMEALYQEGYDHYQQKKFEEAALAFQWLVQFNPYIQKYWLGLGGCFQAQKKYEKAQHCYALAALIEPEDPYPHYYAAICAKALENEEDRQKALDLALERAKNNSLHSSLIEKIRKLRA